MVESKPSITLPYIMAMLVLFLLGVVFVGLVLYLRPAVDPLLVIAPVMGFVVSIGTGIAAFMKSQETHLTVNSQLDAWKKEFFELAHAKGVIEGTDREQVRVAEQKRISALTSGQPTPAPAEATPVIVKNEEAIPVKQV